MSEYVFVNVNVKVNVIVIVIVIKGTAVECVYISLDVGRLYVAYSFQEAMRKPDCRDKRGEKLTPTSFFVSISFSCL